MSPMCDTRIRNCIAATKIYQTLDILKILIENLVNVNIHENIFRFKAILVFLSHKRRPTQVLAWLEDV